MSTVRTPKCLACGAKFSHNKATLACSNCGMPDEIALLGPKVIARWKRKTLGKRRIKQRRPSTHNRKIKAHGR